jgi:acyl carrier protein
MDKSSPDAVSAALMEILRDDLNVDIGRVTRESHLVDEVGLDSVAFAVGMVAIEDKLGVVLSEEDLLTSDTVGDLEDAILAKVPTVSRVDDPGPATGPAEERATSTP